MAVLPGLGTAYPLTLSVRECRNAVGGGRHFHAHPWAFADDAAKKANIEAACRVGHQPRFDLHARLAQARNALTVDRWVGVSCGNDHACDTGGFDRVDAGWCSSMVGTGLQRDVGGGPLHAKAFGMRVS